MNTSYSPDVWGENGWVNANQREPKLNEAERELRIQFVDEYMKDRSIFNAALRIGFNSEYAREQGQSLFQSSFVQRLIADRDQEVPKDTEYNEDNERHKLIASLYKEANDRGPGSSHSGRVSALKEIARILNFTNDDKMNVNVIGGVMVAPGISSIEDWEKEAKEKQEQLVQETKEKHE